MFYPIILLISLSQFFGSIVSENVTTRIIGGDNIYEPVPYQISLQRLINGRWRIFCSGTIISADYLLTAAHCVNELDAKFISILAGTNNLSSRKGFRHFALSYKIHEQYKKLQMNDIALIKVFPPFSLNGKTVAAIKFTETTPVGGGVPLILTGWGSMNQSGIGSLPDQLQVLTTYSLDESECRKHFPKMQSTEMCTLRANLKGACNGDSGGPLVTFNKEIVAGIVSFGSKKCASGFPDYYTRVSSFVEWILYNIYNWS